MEEEAENQNGHSERRYANAADQSSYESVLHIFKDETFQTSVLKPVMLKILSEPIQQAVSNEVERYMATLVKSNDTNENKRPMIDSLIEANAHLVDTVRQYQSAMETSVPSESAKGFLSSFRREENVGGQKTNNEGKSSKRHASWSASTSDDDSTRPKVIKISHSAVMSPGKNTRPKGIKSCQDLKAPEDSCLGTSAMKTSTDTVTPGNKNKGTNGTKTQTGAETSENENISSNVTEVDTDIVTSGNESESPNATKTQTDQETLGNRTVIKTQTNAVTSGNENKSPYVKKTNLDAVIIDDKLQDNPMPKSPVAENIHFKMTESAWRNLADQEIDEGRKEGIGSRQGTHVVLCIDTSGSMNEGNAWSQVQKFYDDYLDGIEQIKDQDAHYDNIAVVTFGHETKVQQRLTKKLQNLRGLLDNIKPRGPSPIFGGLVMAGAAARTSKFSFAFVNYLQVRPKIILVTDGKPTELSLREGPDVANPRKLEQTKEDILAEVENLRREQIDLHCIYVGQNADRAFLKSLQSECVMELMSYRDGEKMAFYTVLKCKREGDQRFVINAGSEPPTSLSDTQITPGVEQFSTLMNMLTKQLLPEQEAQRMTDLLKSLSTKGKMTGSVPDLKLPVRGRYKTATITMAGDRLINVYKEINDGNHPAVGTRVERDDDWTWGNQDNNNNGTIIGHATDPGDGGQCWVHVEWDDDKNPEKGKQNVYRYKMDEDMEGDVRETIEDRKPPPGKVLAVGSRVIPGDGFCGDKTDKKGTVIRFHGNRVEVKWDEGSRGRYRFGSRASEIVPMMDPDRTAFVPVQTTQEIPTSSEEGAPKINITDKQIQQIAQTIAPGWQILGTELGVGNVQMNHIARDYRESIVMQIVNMLIVWKNSTENHTLDVLVDAIRRSGVMYDNDRLEAIMQEIRGTIKK